MAASRTTVMASTGVITRPTASGCPYRHEKSRDALMPTIQSARSRQSAALYSASYSVDGFRWANPSRIAFSSMLDSHRREKGFLQPACWYTKRKISSPSRPASVAQTMLSTSGRCISFCRTPNCFLVDADTRYCHFCGRMGKSAMLHLTYCPP